MEFLAYTLLYMSVNLMMQNYLYGYFRWPWISELYEYVQSVHLLPAIISVILNPTKPTFKVTAKDESVDRSRVSEIGLPFFIIFFVLLAGVGMTVYKVVTEPWKTDVTLVVGAWNLLNLLMAGCALGVVSERAEMQRSRRVVVRRRCEFLYEDVAYPATIEDVSVHGARLTVFGKLPEAVASGGKGEVRFKPHAEVPEDRLPIDIRNVQPAEQGASVGCRYDPQRTAHYQLIADLIFANSSQWSEFQQARRVNPGVIKGTLWFFGLCIFQTGRGLVYFSRRLSGRERAEEARRLAESVR
jgi:cellulose synthase (UDP-forming)